MSADSISKDDSVMMSRLEDKLRQCEEQYCVSHTAFLDVRQCALAENRFKHSRHVLYGGYEDAERRIMVFLPDYCDTESAFSEDNPLEILRVSIPKGGKKLSHRDYLGSLLALGIDRSITGDILVRDDGADIIILKSMEEFLLSNYSKAGHSNLSTSIVPVSELMLSATRQSLKTDTVASLRLDNIVGSGFNLSRTKAQDAIKGGIVFINGIMCEKPDKELSLGDKIVFRGKGKLIIEEIGKKTRKDRIFISYKLYI